MHRTATFCFGMTLIATLVLSTSEVPQANAKVFHSKRGALRLAFPGATVKPKNLFLTTAEAWRVRSVAGSKLSSRMVTVYVGRKGGRCTGYGFIDTHRVRTKPQTLMIVISPQGTVLAVHVLAFFEPLNYLSGKRWLARFAGKSLSSRLQVSYQIAGIAGSTLTAYAVTRAVRRALAVHRTVLRSGKRAGCSK